MADLRNPYIIPGEASESDDDTTEIVECTEENTRESGGGGGSAVLEGASSSTSAGNILPDVVPHGLADFLGAVDAEVERSQDETHETLLHKKLKESNCVLKEDLKDFSRSNYISAARSLDEVNQQLLNDQIIIQKAEQIVRRALHIYGKINCSLGEILSHDYIPDIKIPY